MRGYRGEFGRVVGGFEGCVMQSVKCRQAVPGLSADGTWLPALSSCGSENRFLFIINERLSK